MLNHVKTINIGTANSSSNKHTSSHLFSKVWQAVVLLAHKFN